jgi:hypothetical protein
MTQHNFIVYEGFVISEEGDYTVVYYRGSFVKQFERVHFKTYPQTVSEAIGWIDSKVVSY